MMGIVTSERYCGNISPENLTAVSSVQFTSGPQNYSGSGYGFKAVYSKQFRECREGCGLDHLNHHFVLHVLRAFC